MEPPCPRAARCTWCTINRRRKEEEWMRTTVDPLSGPWTRATWTTMNHARGHEPNSNLLAPRGPPRRVTRVLAGLTQLGPLPSLPSPVRAQSTLTGQR